MFIFGTICIFSHPKLCLDSSKHFDHSFEKLIRSSRTQSPFHRDFSSSHRDLKSSTRDNYSTKFDSYSMKLDTLSRAPESYSSKFDNYSSKLDNYSSKLDSYSSKLDSYSTLSRDSLSASLPYRSKSYNGDLSRISYSTPYTSSFDDHRLLSRPEPYTSDRSRSRSVSHLDTDRSSLSNFSPSYVNTYSRHHSHHNHHPSIPPRVPPQISNRSRFHTRSAYKAYRSRSVNRLDDHDFSISQSPVRPHAADLYRAPSTTQRSARSFLSSARFSKSLSDIRATQSRINNEISLYLQRASSSIRNIDDYSELANHILNPDLYVRWLKNKWDMEENYRRQQSLSAWSYSEDMSERLAKNSRLRGNSYGSRMKYFHESRRYPTFSQTIRGKTVFKVLIEF